MARMTSSPPLAPATIVVSLAVAYLLLAWGAFWTIDVFNVLGLRDALVADPHQQMWVRLFREGRPTEMLQWLALGGTAVAGATASGMLSARGRRGHATFWLLMSITAVLMLIEDAGNPRHFFGEMARYHLGMPARIATELTYFAILASIPLYALFHYWRCPWASPATRRYLIAGVVFYAIATMSSGTRDVGEWYVHVGAYIDQVVLSGRLLPLAPDPLEGGGTGFHLMDSLVEESIELLGAAMLFASALAYLKFVQNGSPPGPSSTNEAATPGPITAEDTTSVAQR